MIKECRLRKFTVSTETLKKTTKCSRDFSCLATGKCGNQQLCKVVKRYDKNMLEMELPKNSGGVSCPYKFSYGAVFGHICTCPTFHALYEQQESERGK